MERGERECKGRDVNPVGLWREDGELGMVDVMAGPCAYSWLRTEFVPFINSPELCEKNNYTQGSTAPPSSSHTTAPSPLPNHPSYRPILVSMRISRACSHTHRSQRPVATRRCTWTRTRGMRLIDRIRARLRRRLMRGGGCLERCWAKRVGPDDVNCRNIMTVAVTDQINVCSQFVILSSCFTDRLYVQDWCLFFVLVDSEVRQSNSVSCR